jgi:iron complex outermembrane receptor protein
VSSAVFGPDAIGGAVNFISKKPQKRQVVLEARGGQYTTWAGLFSASDKIKDLGLRLSVENEESNGFYTDTDFKKFTASFNSSLAFALGEFNLNWGYQEKEFGAYDFYTPASGYQSKEWTKTYLLNTGFNLNKEGLVIKPNFLWRRHHDKFMLDRTLIRSRYLNHHTTDMYTPSVYFQKELPVVGRAGIGLEYGEEKINSTNLGKHSRDHKSVFIDDSLDITEKLSSGLSFRMDDFQVFHAAYTGQASLRLALRKNDFLRLGVARNIRIPSFTELYYNDPTTLGNSGLSEEKSMNYQLGLDCKREKLSFGITGFFRKEDDFIDWVKTSAAQAKWQVQNITKAYVTGCENYLKLKINDIFDLDCSYTYANRNVRQQGLIYKYGKNYARHLLNNTFNFRLPFGAQALAFTYKKKAGRNGWFILDAHLSYKVNKHTQVFLNASNLLGIGYQEIEGIPSPRRWVEGGARLNW